MINRIIKQPKQFSFERTVDLKQESQGWSIEQLEEFRMFQNSILKIA